MVKLKGNSIKVIGIVVVVIAITTIFFLREKKTVVQKEVFNPNDIVTESLDEPDESTRSEVDVPADLPKRIIIPKLGVSGYIQLVGIDQYGRIAVPSNIYIAGWYINSVRPGDSGLSIIDGHRSGKINSGVFYNLEDLKKDDKVTIEYGDGSLREFLVTEVIQIVTEDAQDIMYERVEGIEKQLVLVTCGGEYDKEQKTFVDRIIVRAKGI